jgi:hypothetical protein
MKKLQLDLLLGITALPVHRQVVKKRITLLEGEEKELSRKRQLTHLIGQDQCNQKVVPQDMNQHQK